MPETYQARVQPWLDACFGRAIAIDRVERNHRFLEEALEAVQAAGCTAEEAHKLVDYVYGRPAGDLHQEVGGVMNTLAALCLAHGIDMHEAGETELARVWTKVEQIREKQKRKPKHGPLPGPSAPRETAENFARRAHAGQTDKAGLPYTGHLMRVAARARAHAEAWGWPPERVQLVADAAWLHDTVEDTGTTAENLRAAGFAPEAVAAVERLTKPKGVPYLDAIRALIATGDAIAILVKLADMEDNADPARALGDAGEAERVAKYRASARLLRAALEAMRVGGPT